MTKISEREIDATNNRKLESPEGKLLEEMMMNFISDINLDKESPVQAMGIIGRESRRRVRVRYVFWGIVKEQLLR